MYKHRKASLLSLIALLVLVLLTPVGAYADGPRPHNQAEGDNPALDEAASQGAKKSDGRVVTGKQDPANPDWDNLQNTMTKLVLEFYPKAKIKKGKDKIHYEFKNRMYDNPSTNKVEQGPDWGGLMLDVELKQGQYMGVDQVPKKFNNLSYYICELYAPYSKLFDRHLYTRFCYAFDAQPEFIKRLKNLVDEFDTCL